MRFPKNRICLFPVLIFMLLGCSVEQKVAMKMQNQSPKVNVILYSQPEVYCNPSAYRESEEVVPPDPAEIALQMKKSRWLQFIKIDDFESKMETELKVALRKYGMRCIAEDSLAFFTQLGFPKMILDIKQLEIEESGWPLYDEKTISYFKAFNTFDTTYQAFAIEGTDLFYSEFEVLALRVHLWVQVNLQINDSTQSTELVYLEYYLRQNTEGYFVVTPKLNIVYGAVIEEINPLEISTFPINSANFFADLITQYFLNTTLSYQMQTQYKKPARRFWYLNPKSGRVMPIDNPPSYIIQE